MYRTEKRERERKRERETKRERERERKRDEERERESGNKNLPFHSPTVQNTKGPNKNTNYSQNYYRFNFYLTLKSEK